MIAVFFLKVSRIKTGKVMTQSSSQFKFAINNWPPLKGVISQRLGMNFIKTAMLLYMLSF